MNYSRISSAFLGASMFMFGFLKFFDPFKTWYSVQIRESELGDVGYALGITGELVIGVLFLLQVILRDKFSFKTQGFLLLFSSSLVVVIMAVGTYVHLHPNVPAEVLPLKIKPPFIPIFLISLALLEIVLQWRRLWLSGRETI